MLLTDKAIDKRTSVFILALVIIVEGATAYLALPREAAPDIAIPIVVVSTPYLGVSPGDVETLVTQPIEDEINTINEVKELTSSSKEGFSIVRAEFESGYDIDEALRQVRESVDKAKPELPADAEEPEVFEINFSEFPIVTLNLAGNVGLARLKEIAEDMQDKIERVDGVLEAKISGGLEREVRIEADADKLVYYDVRMDDIIFSVRDENRTIPGGNIEVNRSNYLVRVPGEFTDPRRIEDVVVKIKRGDPVYVRDVARVVWGFKDPSTHSRINGEPTVSIDVSKRTGKNIIAVADEVRRIVEETNAALPEGARVEIVNDQSDRVRELVADLESSIFTGLALVVGVLFLFLGFRNAALVAIAIPLSMLVSFAILSWMDVRLNFVVLFALILGLGMLVDNAIVVVENIYKFVEEGADLTTAAKQGAAEVAWPVATSTLTTVSAFFPLLFIPGVTGDFMYFVPLVAIVTLSASLFVALVINPVLASKFVKVERLDAKPTTVFQQIVSPINRATNAIVNRWLPRLLDEYERFLRFALGRKREPNEKINRRNWLGLAAIVAFFVVDGVVSEFLSEWAGLVVTFALGTGTMFVFTNVKLRTLWATVLALLVITQFYFLFDHGVEFFPSTQPSQATAQIETPSGSNLEATNERMKVVEQKVREAKLANVESMVTVVGASSDIFEQGASTPNKATIKFTFIDFDDRTRSTNETADELREILKGVPGVEATMTLQQMGPPVGAPVNVEIVGEDYERLSELSKAIQAEIADVEGLVDLRDDYNPAKPELRVVVDREKAALYNLSTTSIANAVRNAFNGAEASKYRVGEDEYDVTVVLRKEQRQSIEALERLRLIYNDRRGNTLTVPLGSVARVERGTGPTAVQRKDMRRVVTLTGDAAEGYNGNAVLDEVKSRLADYDLPDGYAIEFTGQSEEMATTQSYLQRAFVVAVLLIFMILVIQFDSLGQPFIILTAVVVSLNGVFIGLILFAMPFGVVMTGIGVISLAGVVVNNNIVLIDYMNQLRERGLSRRDAVVEAGRRRFRPVMLTAITTALGLVPLAFGFGFDVREFAFDAGGVMADFWKPMGVAVIFGLLFATFLTLVVVPALYSTVDELPGAIRQFGRGVKSIFTK